MISLEVRKLWSGSSSWTRCLGRGLAKMARSWAGMVRSGSTKRKMPVGLMEAILAISWTEMVG